MSALRTLVLPATDEKPLPWCHPRPLLSRYNDRSPMEQHHAASLFSLLRMPELNILEHMQREQKEQLRRTVIEL